MNFTPLSLLSLDYFLIPKPKGKQNVGNCACISKEAPPPKAYSVCLCTTFLYFIEKKVSFTNKAWVLDVW